MTKLSTNAVLRSNAQILELMAAQFEELSKRTIAIDELKQLQMLSRKCRILSGEMAEAVYEAAAA